MIKFCSPTLAGIKCASLFAIQYKDFKELIHEVARLNRLCMNKDLTVKLLKIEQERCVVYVYRKKMLQSILNDTKVKHLLYSCGYPDGTLEMILYHLMKRIRLGDSFPHEIGIFLDYPYGDVKGFIEHTGKDCLLCGHWKVYENLEAAKTLFHKYDSCKEKYVQQFLNGTSIEQLVVAV